MARSVTRKISQDVRDVASDVQHTLRKAAPRLREDGQEAVAEAAHRMSVAARKAAGEVRVQSKALAVRAGREVKARPFAVGAVVAAVAALVGLALTRKRDRA